MDITTTLFGIPLQSPFVLGSGPLSYGAEGMIRLHKAGAGAVVTKTIRDVPANNPFPHIAAVEKNVLINAEKWTDISGDMWISEEIPAAKKAGVVVGASIGHTPEEVEHWIGPADKAGADFFELVSYQPETIISMVEVALKLTNKPVVVKISPNWTNAVEYALKVLGKGIAGITAIDSVGPVLSIDIHTARPLVGGQHGFGWLTGAAIKPVALRYVAEVARKSDKPVIGLGGVITGEDAVEMLMAGAGAVGICTAPMLRGVEYITVLNKGLSKLLESLGYSSISEVSGASLPYFCPHEVEQRFTFFFDPKTCISCGRCVQVCPYAARTLTDTTKAVKAMELDESRCRYCGLCSSICPTGALYRREV